jgi:hypothetical protein
MFQDVFYRMLVVQSLSHITKHIIGEVDLVILTDDQALVLGIEDLLIKLRRSIHLDHFCQARCLVYISVIK